MRRFSSPLLACGFALVGPLSATWGVGAAESRRDIEQQETLSQVLQSQISSAQDAEASAQEESANAVEDEIRAASAAIRARQAALREAAAAEANATRARREGDELRGHLRNVDGDVAAAQRENARAASALREADALEAHDALKLGRAWDQVVQDRGNATALEDQLQAVRAREDQHLRDEAAQFQHDFNSRVEAVTTQDAARLHATEARVERNVTAEEALEVSARRRSGAVERADEELRLWLMVVIGSLAAAVFAAAGLCAFACRMRWQRSYHLSMIFRLNSERIRCIERIKELRVPIVAAEQARTSGSTGGF